MPNHYTHAKDIPFENWANLHDVDKENYSLLSKDGAGCPHCSQIAYQKIQRSLIEVFGYGDAYVKVIKAKAKLELFELKYAISKDRFYITEINLAKVELEKLTDNDPKEYTYWEMFFNLERAEGRTIDSKQPLLLIQKRTKEFSQRAKASNSDAQASERAYGNGRQNYRNR